MKYEKLFAGNRKKEYYHMPVQKVGTVLLTGVTGFLGAHILDELLSDENCTVYCLMRNLSEDDRRGQISKILKYYFDEKYENEIGSRIIPVEGDITREDLSDELPEQVDLVIHSAASVNHFGKYEYFYQVNTLGTKNVARYAKHTGAKLVYISIISVSGNSFGDSFDSEIAEEERFFDEASLYQGQKLENVYVRSKFEAECMVLDYMLEGLQANIIRVGNLTNRSGDYRFQPNYTENAFLSRVKAALDFGYLPDYLLPLYSEFSPVNDTAKAVVKIAKHFNQEYTVFHVNSDRRLYFHRMVEILKELQIPMEVVSGDRFIKKLREMMATEQSYIYEAFINDLDQSGKLAYDSNIRIENDFTLSYLKELGFEWTEIDLEYVKGYVEWFRELGYFR